MRRAAKVDATHAAIRDGLRKAGVKVLDCARLGNGAPDLLCFSPRTGWIALEVKTPKAISGRKARLTKDQQALHAQVPIQVVDTVDAALQIFGLR